MPTKAETESAADLTEVEEMVRRLDGKHRSRPPSLEALAVVAAAERLTASLMRDIQLAEQRGWDKAVSHAAGILEELMWLGLHDRADFQAMMTQQRTRLWPPSPTNTK